MNFLLRSTNQTTAQQQSVQRTRIEPIYVSKPATTLNYQIIEDPIQDSMHLDTTNAASNEFRNGNGNFPGSNENIISQVDSHTDVMESDGFIVIPQKVPESWTEAPDLHYFRSLDRNFVFPGEQIMVLACLSAYKKDTEIITPFKVAAVMNKNGIGQSPKKQNGIDGETVSDFETVDPSCSIQDNQNGESMSEDIDSPEDLSTGESLLRQEYHRGQTKQLLETFRNSHFFARIIESNESLWSKRSQETYVESCEIIEETLVIDSSKSGKNVKISSKNSITAMIDRGKFDAHTSGGVARGAVKCCSLTNADIVVLLQLNVGVEFLRDPHLEILQFEKCQEINSVLENENRLASYNQDPTGDLLKWLLPLDNSIPSVARPLSPPTLSSSSSIRTTSTNAMVSGSSGSQLFSFGNFRSYSMSSLPQSATPPPAITPPMPKPSFDPEDWSQFSFRKFSENQKNGNEGLLSFRGVPLEPERFSVCCGLEGIYTPGRRWRRKIELIQPVEIRSFSVDCNTNDLLCVHVKNISPIHAPDIVLYIDAITIVSEEASKGGPPLSLAIACIEAGKDYSLPNLALRRGEEHSFILKPASNLRKHSKSRSNCNSRPSHLSAVNTSNLEVKESVSSADKYAVLVSCRCNYTESKLFFKQPTTWRPHISRDLMISVASEMTRQSLGSGGAQLPVQILTLQASNMTSDDLKLTVLAPASFTSPSVMSLSNSPTSTRSLYADFAELAERVVSDKHVTVPPIPDVVPSDDMGCTHLWLQSRVPLGCVPSQSTAAIKLEVFPLTDGIITLDSLQIDVMEKGVTYIPEHSLKINATSSIATAIV